MNKTEKQFKEYMNSKIHVKDTLAKISKRIDFNEKEEKNFMAKNKFLPVLCCFAAVGVVAVGVVTKGFALLEKDAKSMVTIDVNPSVELVLDENDKVLSVRGANDDGKLSRYNTLPYTSPSIIKCLGKNSKLEGQITSLTEIPCLAILSKSNSSLGIKFSWLKG